MNILIISTQNPFKTSGIVAYNLYKGLKEEGINTRMLIKYHGKYASKDIVFMETAMESYFNFLNEKFKRVLIRLRIRKEKVTNPDYHLQDYDQTIQFYNTKKIIKRIKFKPDAIIYLFQQNFLSAKNLYELNKLTGAKILWYLMDTAPLTGGCHYSWDCDGYTKGCGNCPALYSSKKNDQSAVNFNFKQKYLDKTNISIITPTEWQNRKTVESMLFKNKPIQKVLLSIDSKEYAYLPKNKGKEKLGIPTGKKVIFFGATANDHKRKGMNYLIDALEILKKSDIQKQENLLLLIAGNFDPMQNALPFEHRYLGFLENNEQLAAAYHAADVFVCPSIEDSGPMMINQSIMTGTPVVSFEMGVSEDIVITGETGYRAKLMDSIDLAKGINYVLSLSDAEHERLCVNSRKLALSNYSSKISSQKIIQFIQSESWV